MQAEVNIGAAWRRTMRWLGRGFEAQEHYVSRLETRRLQALLAGEWRKAAEIQVQAEMLTAADGGDIGVRHPLVRLLTENLAALFTAMGGENYVGWEVQHPDLGPLLVRIERVEGKSPDRVAAEWRTRALAAEAALVAHGAAAAARG